MRYARISFRRFVRLWLSVSKTTQRSCGSIFIKIFEVLDTGTVDKIWGFCAPFFDFCSHEKNGNYWRYLNGNDITLWRFSDAIWMCSANFWFFNTLAITESCPRRQNDRLLNFCLSQLIGLKRPTLGNKTNNALFGKIYCNERLNRICLRYTGDSI